MPRGNIFKSRKLTLDYNGKNFILLKNDNPSGSKYDAKGASNLRINIEKEMQKSSHEMGYILEEFIVTPEAERRIIGYKKEKLESKL